MIYEDESFIAKEHGGWIFLHSAISEWATEDKENKSIIFLNPMIVKLIKEYQISVNPFVINEETGECTISSELGIIRIEGENEVVNTISGLECSIPKSIDDVLDVVVTLYREELQFSETNLKIDKVNLKENIISNKNAILEIIDHIAKHRELLKENFISCSVSYYDYQIRAYWGNISETTQKYKAEYRNKEWSVIEDVNENVSNN